MKFIIICGARTGSNLLIEILRAHPKVKVYGELFNLNSLNKSDQRSALTDPISYLENKMQANSLPVSNVIGFKMFYYHSKPEQLYPGNYPDRFAVSAPDSLKNRILGFQKFVRDHYDLKELGQKLNNVWEYLKNDYEFRVIHLKRKNKLATFLSLKRAFSTDQWVKSRGIKGKILNFAKSISQLSKRERALVGSKSIFLSYEDCLEAFQKNTDWENDYDNFFQQHNKIEIFYENLCENADFELKKLQELLEIPRFPKTNTSLKKQNTLPLHRSIINYLELKEKFINTPWQDFFSE